MREFLQWIIILTLVKPVKLNDSADWFNQKKTTLGLNCGKGAYLRNATAEP